MNDAMVVQQLAPFYGKRQAVKAVDMEIATHQITAIIGPSGCGKSTILRCLNRMHETILGAYATGTVLLNGSDIYASGIDATLIRRQVGMVFQQPVAFRTRNIYENVAAGLRLHGMNNPRELDQAVESALRSAVLWDEVKDVLNKPGTALSGGQQQRLAIARALAVQPDVLLLDEPCSALDPIATANIEELLIQLKQQLTIVIVTHSMQQAARISDQTAVFMVDTNTGQAVGELVEKSATVSVFTNPQDPRTESYISGQVG
jgi:phosphate transport system ATP-binding protein